MKKKISALVLLLSLSLPHAAHAVVRTSTLPPPTNNKSQALGKSIADYRRSVNPSVSKRLQVVPKPQVSTEKSSSSISSPVTSQQLLSIFAE